MCTKFGTVYSAYVRSCTCGMYYVFVQVYLGICHAMNAAPADEPD